MEAAIKASLRRQQNIFDKLTCDNFTRIMQENVNVNGIVPYAFEPK